MKTQQMVANDQIGARSNRPRTKIDPTTKKITAESIQQRKDYIERILHPKEVKED